MTNHTTLYLLTLGGVALITIAAIYANLEYL
jgi:hypothetical protein